MRILTLQLRSDDGNRVAETSLFITDGWQDRLQDCLDTITHRLDVLERDGPWKPADVVQNSLRPAPEAPVRTSEK